MRLSTVLLFVATVAVMLVVIPGVTAQNPTPTLTPTVAPQPACQLFHATTPQATVRTCAGTDCSAAATVTDDDGLCILGMADTAGWLLVDLEPEDPTSEIGYISADIVAVGPPGYMPPIDDTCDPWEVAVSEAIVRQCAGEGCGILGGLPQGTRMCVLDYGGEYQDWLYVDYSSVSRTLQGWMSVDVARRLPVGEAVIPPDAEAATTDETGTAAQTAPPTLTPQPPLPVCPPDLPVLGDGGELPAYAAEYPYVVVYTVRSGDMLFGLATQFGSTVDLIREANELGGAGTILVGQSLLIPVKEPPTGFETLALAAQDDAALACVTPTPTPLLLAEPPRSSGGPFVAQDVALSAFGTGNIELRSPRSAALLTFSVPSDWLLDGSNVLYLNIDYRESAPDTPRVDERFLVSMLDVYLEEELISSVTLSEGNIGTQTLVIPLPSNLVTQPDVSTYTLQLEFQAEDHCLEDALARLFIRSDLSYFHFEYHTYFPRLDLARYPEPFYTGTLTDERDSVLLVLPDDPSQADYEAGAGIAAGMGQLTFNDIQVQVLRASEVTDEIRQQNSMLLIGEIGKHAMIDELYAANALQTTLTGDSLTFSGEALDASEGVVQLISNPDNAMKAIGVVTGLNEESLRKAAQALSGPPSILGLGGPLAFITETRDVGQAPPGARFETTVTFRDLGVEQLLLNGVGNQIADVRFFAPSGARLAPDASLDFIFTYSGALGYGSNISVLMNSTPIASAFLHPNETGFTTLEQDDQGRYHLKARIPSESVVPGSNNTITMFLDAREQIDCVIPDPLVTWFNVSPDTELFLPREYDDPAQLVPQVGWFPVPFNGMPNLQDVVVSLPAEPTSQDVEQAYQLLARVGSETVGGMAFKPVVAVGELPDGLDLAAYNLLVVGRPSTSPLLVELNSGLPQSFIPGTDTIAQTLDDISYRLPPGYDIGILQALQSPWSAERSILVVTGTGPSGQAQAVGAISQNLYGRRGLAGDVVFVSASDVSVVDTRDLYMADYVVEELEYLQTSAAVQPTETPNLVYTVTPGPTPTDTATASPTPVVTATPIFPTEVQPTALPTFTPLPESASVTAPVQQPEWVSTLLLVTGVVLITTLIFGLLLLVRSRRNNR